MDSWADIGIVFVIVLVNLVYGSIIIATLWNWFVPAMVGIDIKINAWHALGLRLLVYLLAGEAEVIGDSSSTTPRQAWEQSMNNFRLYLVMLGLGALAHHMSEKKKVVA